MISILCIDDSPEEQDLVAELVRSGDADVKFRACFGGKDGIACVRDVAFDCVFLDLRLDGESGLDVLAELRELRPNLPVIVLTGRGNEEAATQAFLAGAAYYLPKRDLTGPTLWTAIDRVLERTTIERELKSKREALERSNRLDAVGQLAAGIAHDFNNQLGALRYCIEFLKHSAVTESSKDKVRTALSVIQDSRNLAGRLLALSKQGDLLAQTGSLAGTLDDLDNLAAAAVSGAAKLEVGAPDTDVYVHCDFGQLLNVLLNLILNAEDAIKTSGQPGIIKVLVHSSDDQVWITVRDNGLGMSKDVLAKCTDPFFTTKQNRNGTGLGLAMAQSFVNDNSGELLLHSSIGEGTEVIVVLPMCVKPEHETARPVSVPRPEHSDARILVVEDQIVLARITREIIEAQGYAVELAVSAEKALEFLQNDPKVDLVVTDLKMPGMSGFELAKKVRQNFPDIKVIYLTGYDDSPEGNEQEVPGPVLQKPVEPQDLLATIGKVLAN